MRNPRPTSKFAVHTLNLAPLKDKINATYLKQNPDADVNAEGFTAYDTMGEQGVVKTEKGYVALDTEGVISIKPSTDSNPLHIDLYAKSNGGFAMFPWTTIALKPSDFIPLLSTETVTLDKFIRIFGSRLEGNFWIATEHLAKLNKKTRKPRKVAA